MTNISLIWYLNQSWICWIVGSLRQSPLNLSNLWSWPESPFPGWACLQPTTVEGPGSGGAFFKQCKRMSACLGWILVPVIVDHGWPLRSLTFPRRRRGWRPQNPKLNSHCLTHLVFLPQTFKIICCPAAVFAYFHWHICCRIRWLDDKGSHPLPNRMFF